MHTANATTAVFRLERIGINRSAMSDSILGVVAQKLVKRLCARCKSVGPISREEAGLLSPFCASLPEHVARPVGCDHCSRTGYHGREGVYEIVKFYPEISEMIRRGAPVSAIRDFALKRGDLLMSGHAVEKVRQLVCDPAMIHDHVLLEEAEYRGMPSPSAEPSAEPPPASAPAPIPAAADSGDADLIGKTKSVLIAEDDADTRALIRRALENRGYEVREAADGIEALRALGERRFDLILSDIEMPNLDGMKLMEMKAQKAIPTPVVFLTSRSGPEDEMKAFALGAEDFIRKPVRRDVLLARVQRALTPRPGPPAC